MSDPAALHAAILFSDIVVPLKAAGIDLDIVPDVGPVIAHPVRTEADVAAGTEAVERIARANNVHAVRVAQDREGKAMGGDLQWSKSVVRRCLEERQPVRSVVQSDQEALELGQSVYDLKLRAVMCAPQAQFGQLFVRRAQKPRLGEHHQFHAAADRSVAQEQGRGMLRSVHIGRD